MKRHVAALTLLAALTALPTCKQAVQNPVTVQFLVGDVRIVSASGEKTASIGDVMSYDDAIITGKLSVVELNYGTRGVIRIVENSNVTLAALKDKTEEDQSRFDMKKGKMFVVMSKLSKGSGFSIITPTTLAAVRGTSFMIVSEPGTSKICVLKGRVLVQLAKEGKLAEKIEKMLDANRKVVVSEDLVDKIIAGKKQIETVPLNNQEVAEIRAEIKKIKINEQLDPEAQKEVNEIINDEGRRGTLPDTNQDTQNKDVQPVPSL